MPLPSRQRKIASDYLKFFGVIKDFVLRRYKINENELYALLFFHSERYFTKEEYEQMRLAMTTSRSRFDAMLSAGLIHLFADAHSGRKKKLYEVSHQGRVIVRSFYDKLEGRVIMPLGISNSPYKCANATNRDRRAYEYMRYINRRTKNKGDAMSDLT